MSILYLPFHVIKASNTRRDLDMRLAGNSQHRVHEQLAPRCLFPTSPLEVGGTGVNRRLFLSSKKNKKRKQEEDRARVNLDGVQLADKRPSPSQTDVQSTFCEEAIVGDPPRAQTCIEESLSPARAEVAAQTDQAHSPASAPYRHAQAPHTPADHNRLSSLENRLAQLEALDAAREVCASVSVDMLAYSHLKPQYMCVLTPTRTYRRRGRPKCRHRMLCRHTSWYANAPDIVPA